MNRSLYHLGVLLAVWLFLFAGCARAASSTEADEEDRPEGALPSNFTSDPVVTAWIGNYTKLCQLEEILWLVKDDQSNSSGAETYTIFKNNKYYIGAKAKGKWEPRGETDTTYELEGSYLQIEKNGEELGWIGGISEDERRILAFKMKTNCTVISGNDTYVFSTLPAVLWNTLPDDTFEDSNCTQVCCQPTSPRYVYFSFEADCESFAYSTPSSWPGKWTNEACSYGGGDQTSPTAPPGEDGQPIPVDSFDTPEEISTEAEPMPGATIYVKSCQQGDVDDIDCKFGYINQDTCACTCTPNYEGEECEDCKYEEDDCKHGEWDECECKCDPTKKWSGQFCDTCSLVGPNGMCYVSGMETQGYAKEDCEECECLGGWKPPYCLECSIQCSGNKENDLLCQSCVCKGQWTGPNCDVCGLTCVQGHGVKDDACESCICKGGYTGDSCETCNLQCGAHGTRDENCLYCECRDGYTGRQCESKCGDGIVQANEQCDGGDHCTPECGLKIGYQCVDGVCGDVDECASSVTNKCPGSYRCQNVAGSYTCVCPPEDPNCPVFDPLAHPMYFKGGF